MFLKFKKEVEVVLKDALRKAFYEYQGELGLEESEHADISSLIAFSLARTYKKPPDIIAEDIVAHLEIPPETLISEVVPAGPYINFFVNDLFLHETLQRVKKKERGANFERLSKKEKVIVEHTSANPDGPLHIGHLRNSIIGDVLVRVLKKARYDVETHYYINDMGRQIAICVWGAERFKKSFDFDEDKKGDHAVADVYISASSLISTNEAFLTDVEELMRKYEAGEEETVRKYKTVVKKCISGIKASLQRLNIQHDLFVWESEFVRKGLVEEVVEEIKRSGNIKFAGNALLLQLDGIEKELVIQRTNGTFLYTTRDIAYHRWKSKRCNRMIDVFGKDHELVSLQLSKVLEMQGIKKPEFVIFEFVSLPGGSLSTRTGRYISADELIEKIEERAYEEVKKKREDLGEDEKKEIARKVGIGALRYDMVKVSPDKRIVFDLEEALDIEKKGAPFIQYSHARACSILRMAKERGLALAIEDDYDASLLREESEIELIKKLSKMEYVIEMASSELKPHLVAKYARELAESFNLFYKDCPVLNAEEELRKARISLVLAAKAVLSLVLDVLGIEAPEEM